MVSVHGAERCPDLGWPLGNATPAGMAGRAGLILCAAAAPRSFPDGAKCACGLPFGRSSRLGDLNEVLREDRNKPFKVLEAGGIRVRHHKNGRETISGLPGRRAPGGALAGERGDEVKLDQVLLVTGDGGDTRVGTPLVWERQRARPDLLQGKAKKCWSTKRNAARAIAANRGHRQLFTAGPKFGNPGKLRVSQSGRPAVDE